MDRLLLHRLVALLLLTASSALAQESQPSNDAASTPSLRAYPFQVEWSLIWLQTPTVHQELKLTKTQVEQISKLRSEFDAIARQICVGYFDVPEERRESLTSQVMTKTASLQPRIEAVLSPGQMQRFEQIIFRSLLGLGALDSPVVMDKLALTTDQRKLVADVVERYRQRAMGLCKDDSYSEVVSNVEYAVRFAKGDDVSRLITKDALLALMKEREPKHQALEQKALEGLATILSPEQQRTFEAWRGQALDESQLQSEQLDLEIRIEARGGPNEYEAITFN
jgi:hypothetical protein